MPNRITICSLLSAALAVAPVRAAAQAVTVCASIGVDGQPANNNCREAAVSADGRFVAFTSSASNLVSGTQTLRREVFLRDMQTGSTVRISEPLAGGTANAASYYPSISEHGRFVAFTSDATNLVPGDTNNVTDVFIRDTALNTLERVSVNSLGEQANNASYKPSISADGRLIAFWSLASNLVADDTNNHADVFVRDRYSTLTKRVSISWDELTPNANQASNNPVISADGRFVAFLSLASNIVQNDTNGAQDVFVRDLTQNTTVRASVSFNFDEGDRSSGDFGHALSGNGRYLAFSSFATNLVEADTNNTVDIFIRDLVAETTFLASLTTEGWHSSGWAHNPAINHAGDRLAFDSVTSDYVPYDSNGVSDIFVRDRARLYTERVSVSATGLPSSYASLYPVMSADGRYVAFEADARAFFPGTVVTRTQIFLRGPLPLDPTYSADELRTAIRIAAGNRSATTSEMMNYCVAAGAGIDLMDAVRLCRMAAGLDPKP
ncbi:MAG: hypothetical protein GYA63_03625 [Armatimonadetes bacterium]|jgi:hypothetical protein|nr:hypothetical protein [Armatimonadota bacterium]